MRNLRYFHVLFVLLLVACATQTTPTQELSPLQDAYAVRDSIITTKKGLNDARALGKLSKESYDKAWAVAEDADKIVSAQIKSAHEGMVSKSQLAVATAKDDAAKAVLK